MPTEQRDTGGRRAITELSMDSGPVISDIADRLPDLPR
jgi:hypothetical protein